MQCRNEDGVYIDFRPDDYDAMLRERVDDITARFADVLVGTAAGGTAITPEVFPSPKQFYRQRCRLGVCDHPDDGDLCFVMWNQTPAEHRRYFRQGESFELASELINASMSCLIGVVRGNAALRRGLEMVHFHGTQSGNLMLSLLYNRGGAVGGGGGEDGVDTGAAAAAAVPAAACALGLGWEAGAQDLRDALGGRERVHVIGKLKADKAQPRYWPTVAVLGRDHVDETYNLADGRSLTYRQVLGSFSNPNASMCESTLNWLCDCASSGLGVASAGGGEQNGQGVGTATGGQDDGGSIGMAVGSAGDSAGGSAGGDFGGSPVRSGVASGGDLLEIYCGNGNHTVALAPRFRRALAVDINPALVEAARENLRTNGVTNAHVVAGQSQKFCRDILRSRRYKGLDVGEEAYDFTTVLVDPPRAGLDDTTLRLVRAYPNILYISCSKDALRNNLDVLCAAAPKGSHDVVRMAVFDHFPYTKHIECGVMLRRRDDNDAAAVGGSRGEEVDDGVETKEETSQSDGQTPASSCSSAPASGYALAEDPVVDFWANEADQGSARSALWTGGATAFAALDVEEACRQYEQLWSEHAPCRPYMWARGIALFYKGHFASAAAQFRLDVDSGANADDAEEHLWLHLCMCAAAAAAAAATAEGNERGELPPAPPVFDDASRPIIRAVSRVFAGVDDVDVLRNATGLDDRDSFYRHLYCALYLEQCGGGGNGAGAGGDARAAMLAARSGAYCSGAGAAADFMCSVCLVHCAVRGWAEEVAVGVVDGGLAAGKAI